MSGLSTKIYAAVTARLTGSDDLGTLEYNMTMGSLFKSLTSGTGANQANVIFTDERTVADSASDNIDLAGGLDNPFGDVITFDAVKLIYIKASATNTDDIILGGAMSYAFQGPLGDTDQTVAIAPGGVFLVAAPVDGWPVSPGTGDILTILNASGDDPATYDIVLVGVSA